MKNSFALVIPLVKMTRSLGSFDYGVPATMKAAVGDIVSIPFRAQTVWGIVVEMRKTSSVPAQKMKSITGVLPASHRLSKEQLASIDFLAARYAISPGHAARLMVADIPKRASQKALISLPPSPSRSKSMAVPFAWWKSASTQVYKYASTAAKISLYKKIIDAALRERKQVLIIAPDIHARTVLTAVLAEVYADELSVYDMPATSKGARYAFWMRCKTGDAKIIIGTRSAAFLPLRWPAAIIVDDEDSDLHKQEEPNPRYNAKEVAHVRARFSRCPCVMVSACPSIETLYAVAKKKWSYTELDRAVEYPTIEIVDRAHLYHARDFSLLGGIFAEELEKCYTHKRKAFILCNRKGIASLVMCDDCKHILRCPHDGATLAVTSGHDLLCHHCFTKIERVIACPRCAGANLREKGFGDAYVYEEVKRRFPLARVALVDVEHQGHDPAMTEANNADIIVGTSFAIPHISFESVFLIEVLNADLGLGVPDYRTEEKHFNLLYRLAQSIPSGKKRMLIQTFSPDHRVYAAVTAMSIRDFYTHTIRERTALNFPPLSHYIVCICKGVDSKAAYAKASELYAILQKALSSRSACFLYPPIEVRKGDASTEWHIAIKSTGSDTISAVRDCLPPDVLVDTSVELD